MSTRLSPIVSAILTPLLVISPLWAQAPVPLTNSPVEDAASPSIQLRVVDSDGAQVRVSSRTAKGFTVQVTDTTGGAVSEAAVAFRLPDSGPTGTFPDGTHATVVYTDAAGLARVNGVQWGEMPGPLAIRVTATKGTSHAGMLIEQTLSTAAELASAAKPVPPAIPAPPAATPMPSQAMVTPPSTPVPGTVRTVPAVSTGASAAEPSLPMKPSAPVSMAQANPEPSVSVTTTSASSGASTHSGAKKWLIIAAIAAGAGVGAAMAMKGKSTTPAASAPALSIGTPTVSVGHP